MEHTTERLTTADGTRLMLAAAQTGDRSAFGRLFAMYWQPLLDFIVRRDSRRGSDEIENMVQEVFLRAWQRRCSFRSDSSAKTFLFGIAINVVHEHRRAARRRSHIPLEDLSITPQAADTLGDIDRLSDARQLVASIQPAIKDLAPRQQEAFRMVLVDGQSVVEAARRTNCTPKTIRDRLTAALARLRLRFGLLKDERQTIVHRPTAQPKGAALCASNTRS